MTLRVFIAPSCGIVCWEIPSLWRSLCAFCILCGLLAGCIRTICGMLPQTKCRAPTRANSGCAAALRVHGPDADVSQDSYDLPAFVCVPLSRATGLWRCFKMVSKRCERCLVLPVVIADDMNSLLPSPAVAAEGSVASKSAYRGQSNGFSRPTMMPTRRPICLAQHAWRKGKDL